MAKPKKLSLNQKEQKKILSVYKRDVKDARKIAELTDMPHRQVMLFLETQGLRQYSNGSYC